MGACGHHEIALALEETLARVDAARAADASEAYGFLLHRRDGARSELPASGLAGEVGAAKLGPLAAGPAPGHRGWPGVVGEVELLPAPGVLAPVHRLPRRRCVVRAQLDGDRCVALVRQHLPLRSAVDGGLTLAVALEQERRVPAELRGRAMRSPVPDQGGEHVAARAQVRCEVDGLVAPVHEIGTLGARRDLLAVHEEPVPVVRRHVDDEVLGPRDELERTAEVEDAVRLARSRWVRDPAGGGGVREDAWLGPPLRLAQLGQTAQERQQQSDRSSRHPPAQFFFLAASKLITTLTSSPRRKPP